MTAQTDLKDFTAKMQAMLREAASQRALHPVAEKAIEIIQKRTRLGYGVPDGTNGTAERFRLKPLSERYVNKRKHAHLDEFASPSRSNLTFTGQLLASLAVIRIAQGSIVIGPVGTRKDGQSNAAVGAFVSAGGRPFLSLSKPEAEQLRRFYRNTFGDLLKNRRLT